MDSEELLAQLADIHLPEPVSFWPPAPGWWVLAVLLIVAAIWLVRRARVVGAQRRVKAQALREFDACYQNYSNSNDIDIQSLKLRYVNEANSVLKRVALVHFTDSGVAGLGGLEWVDFIRKNGDSSLLTDSIAAALSHGRFQTKIDVDVDALHDFGRVWISGLYDNVNNVNQAKTDKKVANFEEVAQ